MLAKQTCMSYSHHFPCLSFSPPSSPPTLIFNLNSLMATTSFTFSLLTFLLSLSTITPSLSSDDVLSFVYGGCSQLKYNPDDAAYAANLRTLLTALSNSATYAAYNRFSVAGSSPSGAARGLYQCRGDLPMPDCAACVAHAAGRLGGQLCPGSCGGALQLRGCFLKYDNESFFGVNDKTVLFKKCGGGPSAVPAQVAARDAVLDGLAGGSGTYRVGGSGDVRGMAQCVGDLSGGQCRECVGEAVGQVKAACGNAGAADVYLGKCYVRYTLGGGSSYFSSHNGSIKNMGVKTFALVIGLLAAIVILIIFLTFLCRTFAGSRK